MQGNRPFLFRVAKSIKTRPRHYLFIAVVCFLCMGVSSCPGNPEKDCGVQGVTVLRGATGTLFNFCRVPDSNWLVGDSIQFDDNDPLKPPPQGVTIRKVGLNVYLTVASDAPQYFNESFRVTYLGALGELGFGDLSLTTGFPLKVRIDPTGSGGGYYLAAEVMGEAPPFRFSWSPTTGLSDPTSGLPFATVLNTTTYTVTVTDSAQGVASASVTIRVPLSAIVSASPAGAVDPGQSVQLAAIVSGGTLPYTYAWNPAELLNNAAIFDPIATQQVTTTFGVRVTDGAGTQVVGSIPVRVNLKLTVSATPPSINAGESSQLLATVTGGSPPYSYQWSPAAGLSNANIFNPMATPPVTSAYTVTVTDAFGGRAQGVITVSAGGVTGPAARLSLIWLSPVTLRVDASASTPGSSPIVRYEYTQAWFGDPNQPADVCYYPPGFPSLSISCMQNLENATPWIYDFAGTSGETVRVKVVDANGSSSWTTQVAPPGP